MGDSLNQERPAKRLKVAPQQSAVDFQNVFMSPTTSITAPLSAGDPWAATAIATASTTATATTTVVSVPGTQFAAPWHHPSQTLISLEPTPDGAHGGAWPSVPGLILTPVPVPVLSMSTPLEAPMPAVISTPSTIEAAPSFSTPQSVGTDLSLANHEPPLNTLNDKIPEPQPHLPISGTVVPATRYSQVRVWRNRRPRRRSLSFVSPFGDCRNSFGDSSSQRFYRPSDGKVNGYIKFHWPARKAQLPRESSVTVVEECDDDNDDDDGDHETPRSSQSALMTQNHSNGLVLSHHSPDSVVSTINGVHSPIDGDFKAIMTFISSPNSSRSSPSFSFVLSPRDPSSADRSSPIAPRMVPPQFGMLAKMDHMDRQFWSFYIQNWCPGRSVLGKTNLWLKDFAQMHDSPGVCAAIQSLAGIYIYDYQPMDAIRKRTNQRFNVAESRLCTLLADADNVTDEEASELITISSILSMQDIVLTERRLKKLYTPRWLLGYKQSEYFLELIDEGSRFWRKANVQISALRISQSIIVGRAIILAQPMMPLPSPDNFDPEDEASRFGWLLYGEEQDVYEIHGGCGFSKKLLHVMSQITYCAARLQQDPETPVAPLTAQFLLGELQDMRQWSSESRGWDEAKANSQTIEWVRAMPEGYTIDSSGQMTDVTAEAWRLAAIIYLQCRALRLPRTCSDVVDNMRDLAKCIRIMPTSGTHFTAQAPLFPVFLLGLLAANREHREVSNTWFGQVVSTPVRSSVPPLYDTLRRVWDWIEIDPKLSPSADYTTPDTVGERYAWWEYLVHKVQAGEQEVLCLT